MDDIIIFAKDDDQLKGIRNTIKCFGDDNGMDCDKYAKEIFKLRESYRENKQ